MMPAFTLRPVKAGLAILGEIQLASPEELQRQQVIALGAIADALAVIAERLQQLTEWASLDELRKHVEGT